MADWHPKSGPQKRYPWQLPHVLDGGGRLDRQHVALVMDVRGGRLTKEDAIRRILVRRPTVNVVMRMKTILEWGSIIVFLAIVVSAIFSLGYMIGMEVTR